MAQDLIYLIKKGDTVKIGSTELEIVEGIDKTDELIICRCSRINGKFIEHFIISYPVKDVSL